VINLAARSFVAAGSGEAREGGTSYEGRIIRPGDHSPEAMREKASFVLGAMEQRMVALGFSWADVTATQVYKRAGGRDAIKRRLVTAHVDSRPWGGQLQIGTDAPLTAVWPVSKGSTRP
jgi:hypothetical protein